jgi:signal transduction histidine kinase
MRLGEPKGPRLPLSARLAMALLVLVASFAGVLLFYVVPRTTTAFLERGDTLLREGSLTMRELAELQTIGIRTVLTDLIEHNADSRRLALRDLPLELLGGDVTAIREAIASEDAQRSTRQKDNVQMLSREMIRRADRRIDSDLAELAARQHTATMNFANDLRTTQFVLVGSSLGVLLLVLGFGLHRYVVRPTLLLHRATQRVAGGELAVDLPSPSNDELGDLARAFASMVVQLRDSRGELQRLAANLEHEVERKTHHLEKALAELRDSHQQLAQAERLASLGTLAGGIAHEFHNVIGGIRGCAGELLAEETKDDRRETLGVIQRAADRATGIVQQLLRFARRSVEQRSDVDLATVATDALRLCEPAARRQNVAIERALPKGSIVRGDADGLHQVLVNLVTNALQAMPTGGTLAVRIAEDTTSATISVADSGIGIAAADLPHLFEPFFTTRTQGEDHTRRGTGLGLSVSYGIVTAHGGTLTVASTPGKGATFTIHLPKAGIANGS